MYYEYHHPCAYQAILLVEPADFRSSMSDIISVTFTLLLHDDDNNA